MGILACKSKLGYPEFRRKEKKRKMEPKQNNPLFDKIEFIVHRIIAGILFWIVLSVFITFQRYVTEHINNYFFNFLLCIIPYLLLSWFTIVSRKKSHWKPFGSNSSLVGISIILIVSIALCFSAGILKVSI